MWLVVVRGPGLGRMSGVEQPVTYAENGACDDCNSRTDADNPVCCKAECTFGGIHLSDELIFVFDTGSVQSQLKTKTQAGLGLGVGGLALLLAFGRSVTLYLAS